MCGCCLLVGVNVGVYRADSLFFELATNNKYWVEAEDVVQEEFRHFR